MNCENTCGNVEVLEDVTEIDERGLRRLAQSRGCFVAKTGSTYQVIGYGYSGIPLTDDEAWAVLQSFPQVQTLSGRGVPVTV